MENIKKKFKKNKNGGKIWTKKKKEEQIKSWKRKKKKERKRENEK